MKQQNIYLFPSLLVSFFLSGLTSDLIGVGVICITITMSVQVRIFSSFTFSFQASPNILTVMRKKKTLKEFSVTGAVVDVVSLKEKA
jgi:hypothetical protein